MAKKVTGNIDFSIVEHTPERVIGTMPVQPGILNAFGTTHAGALLWFADVCATVLAFGDGEMSPGVSGFPLAINLNATLLGNQKEGIFTATSSFVKQGRTVSAIRTVIVGGNGRLVAEVTTSHVAAK